MVRRAREGRRVAGRHRLGIGPPNGEGVVDGPVAIVPRTANSRSSLHDGKFLGFMPGTLLDSIPGEGAFETVPDAAVPTSPPQPATAPDGIDVSGATVPREPSTAASAPVPASASMTSGAPRE